MTPTSPPPTRLAEFTLAVRARLGIPPPLDAAFQTSVEKAIERAEASCAAEIVLVVRPESGSYGDVCWLTGAIVAWLTLWGILFSEANVHPAWVPFEVLAVFCFAAWMCHSTAMRRWFVSRSRLDRRVRDGANVAQFEEGILKTPGGTGILIYWSRLERRIIACPDPKVSDRVPADVWSSSTAALELAARSVDPRGPLIRAIADLGEKLALHLPIPPGHLRVLSNRPRGTP